MLFEIERASKRYDTPNEKPCANAQEIMEIKGEIVWGIEINSVNDLLNLIDEVGERLVLGKECILIYDDYIE